MLIPQSLAYAQLAGMPPERGLPTPPPCHLSSQRSSLARRTFRTGPVALTSLLTFGALSSQATPGSTEYVKLGIVLALIVGVVRIALGLLRGGVIAYLLSEPVLMGFVPGAAILICASQIPTALGAPPGDGGVIQAAVTALASPSDGTSP